MFIDFDTSDGAFLRERFQIETEERQKADRRFDDALYRIDVFNEHKPHFTNCTPIKCACAEEMARWDNASNVVDDHASDYLPPFYS